ncbi:MAG: hypothetical protein P8P29_04790 [Flavobacteriaceae bacterium]|nr:hypothetical protein [Flavobacteriaceae bacterium]
MAKYSVRHSSGKVITFEGPADAKPEEIKQAAARLYQEQQIAERESQEQFPEEQLPEEQPQEMRFDQALSQAGRNLPASSARLIGDLFEAVTNPVDTTVTLSQVIGGGLRKGLRNLGVDVESREDSEQMFDAVANQLAEKYTTWDGFKRALAEDPASILADASLVLTGGAVTAAKTAASGSKLAKGAQVVAEVAPKLDPVVAVAPLVGKGASKVAGAAAPAILSFTSGVGRKSIEKAYESGVEGGAALKQFRDNMKGEDPILILDDALANLETLRQKKNADYQAGMKELSESGVEVMYNKIDYAINQIAKGSNKLSDGTMDTINSLIRKVKQSKEMGYTTVAQMDDLKQAIAEIGEAATTSGGKTHAETVRKAVVKAIEEVAPDYIKVMEQYGEAAEKMKDLKKTLSVQGSKTNPDTALKKLLSIMRDNVQTNYGRRVTLAEELESIGGNKFINKIAGQDMASVTPKGMLGRILGAGGVGYGAVTGSLTGLLSPGAIAAASTASPRLIGEAAQLTGQASRVARKAAQTVPSTSFSQIGAAQRITEMAEEENR